MTTTLEIRSEVHADRERIRFVTERAFRDMPYAGGDEQDVIDRLRSANALELSLVATMDGEIIGHVAFSPAEASDSSRPWFALGPVSVLPAHQKSGIGSALIRRGLSEIQQRGAPGCILTGNPVYYQRFGFELSPDVAPESEPKEFFMIKLLAGEQPSGVFRFHGAFYGDV